MRIVRIQFDQVVVPSRPDSVNSPELIRPLHQLAFAGHRGFSVQFDEMHKTIIRLHLENGVVGLGESYRGLTVEQLVLPGRQLIGEHIESLNLQDLPIPEGRIYDGFECAVLDAFGKLSNTPLHMFLGGCYRRRVECSYWTGHRSIEDAARKAYEGKQRNFGCIKFKCDLDDPVVEWCRAIRDQCGPDFKVILDPNRRWQTVAFTLDRCCALHEIGNVLCVEDPIPRWDFESYRLLRLKSPIPIAIHVSLPYREMGQMESDAIQALRHHACDFFNFNGGCFPVKRLADTAAVAGVPFWHGSEVDLGILEASYVHKAAACESCTMPSDIFGRLVREHDLLVAPLNFDGRFVGVPDGPGLGVELDEEALSHYSTFQAEVDNS